MDNINSRAEETLLSLKIIPDALEELGQRVELPNAVAKEDANASSPGKVRELPDSLRILVVEDHVDTLRVLGRLLESVGHLVATAQTAAAAMSYVTANDFDMLLSDIGLPDRNGWELVRLIKSVQNVPAIAISGFNSVSDIKKSRDAGFYDHLSKPLDFQLLQATIEQARQVAYAPSRACEARFDES